MIHYFFPIYCCLCKNRIRADHYLCTNCYEQLPRHEELSFFKEGICCFSPFFYESSIKWMLKQLKFGKYLLYANLLAHLMTQALKAYYKTLPHLLIPIPLHKKRLQERGFNQSLEVAKQISQLLKIPVERHKIIRFKTTKPQAQCKAFERVRNVNNAFLLRREIKGNHTILFDDIITTGNTLLECHRLLKNTKISQIDLWAIAKTP